MGESAEAILIDALNNIEKLPPGQDRDAAAKHVKQAIVFLQRHDQQVKARQPAPKPKPKASKPATT